MSPITTIVHFSVPFENMDKFLDLWRPSQDIMSAQPGAIDNIMHRTVDTDSPFQFINVARWESEVALQAALGTSVSKQEKNGVDIRGEFERLGVSMSQNNYTVIVKNSNEVAQ